MDSTELPPEEKNSLGNIVQKFGWKVGGDEIPCLLSDSAAPASVGPKPGEGNRKILGSEIGGS